MKSIDPAKLSIGFTAPDLCTRCGTCGGVCPENAIDLTDRLFPKLIADRCTDCGLCAKTCPGARVDFLNLTETTFGHRHDATSFDGHVQASYLGYATDERLRGGGAGGGVVTALLWDLLKSGTVDGCIVTRMKPDEPWVGEPFIARTYEDLLASQGSRYMIIPLNRALAEVRRRPGRYAVAALPCQVHGLRLIQQHDPELAAKLHLIVGLFCGGSLEPNLVLELLQSKGLRKEDLHHFEFRGGEWPGQMRAHLKDGRILPLHYSNYRDGAYNYCTSLYMPVRCQTCLDGSSEFADVSISDAWTRNEAGEYKFKAHSRLLIRTPRGAEAVQAAMASGTPARLRCDPGPKLSHAPHPDQTQGHDRAPAGGTLAPHGYRGAAVRSRDTSLHRPGARHRAGGHRPADGGPPHMVSLSHPGLPDLALRHPAHQAAHLPEATQIPPPSRTVTNQRPPVGVEFCRWAHLRKPRTVS
jgi:coenzyme F420 hydrogenase subunit beta